MNGPASNVVVAMTRCLRTGGAFGIRFERAPDRPGVWMATWAFRLREEVGRREGYDEEIAGEFAFGPRYPGCPYCENPSFLCCGACQKLCCWDTDTRQNKCTWCGATGTIQGRIEVLRSHGDA